MVVAIGAKRTGVNGANAICSFGVKRYFAALQFGRQWITRLHLQL